MAQQLLAQGQKVALLALLDTVRATKRRYFNFARSYYLKRMAMHWSQLKSFPLHKKIAYVSRIAKKLFFPPLSGNGNSSLENAKGLGPSQYEYAATLLGYSPRQYHGRMTIILSDSIYNRSQDGGWAELVPLGVDAYRATADHDHYLKDQVDHTAELLRQCLEKAEREFAIENI